MDMETDSMKEREQHGNMQDAGHATLDYSMLSSPHSTKLPEANPAREIRLELTGNMERYVWAFNNRTLSEADKILIRQGENVRFVLVNRTMMHHPMHLHGMQFQVLVRQGVRHEGYVDEGWKDTVLLMPGERIRILVDFADYPGLFLYHCHNLEHEDMGMMRNYFVRE